MKVKILKTEDVPKNVCSQKTSFGQTFLEHPLSKNFRTLFRLFQSKLSTSLFI
ncbi:hypothetical protein CNEO4_170031 [Clostridium neonatale]|uniref:Uncharacterized protein n=1 Tax=Clostridium neonatale TaxID=137838 RepID=A0AA86MKD2_9CLOT|nr:hypothetical protein CNEO_43035 [Clostridium neonatale]CAG9713521.1 hypothetical protein CNEO_200012 [Clostridium neonatale]CAI3197335.1 hypothetical protein CNEO2_1530006 [Clostridium neonatale]CAI3209175.1 hypothetical protein CNEO2_560011 [Clostridium neonatale]CAI3230513.1 hypothetical protein CNEO2_190062 [Clostridium neonatale]